MKVWEILKRENIGKNYKWDGIVYLVDETYVGNEVILCYENGSSVGNVTMELMSADFEEIGKSKGWEEVKLDQKYYYIDDDGEIESDYFEHDGYQSYRKDSLNIFSTKEKAEEVAKEQLLYRKMKHFRDTEDKYVDWMNDTRLAWYVFKDILGEDTKYKIDNLLGGTRDLHTIYFTTNELAKRCLNEVVLPFVREHGM